MGHTNNAEPLIADTTDDNALAQAFVNHWQNVPASELSTAQPFVIALCALLCVEQPHPTLDQDYMFERPVTFKHGDGSSSAGRIDCYRRGSFCLEAKKQKSGIHTKGFDDGLLRARSQAENYARALPASEGRPPFVLVVDVGTVIEVYAEFSRSGATYTPFPDPRSHRIKLVDLLQPEVRERLRQIWQTPDGLNPARISAKVTRAVAELLAELAKDLETSDIYPQNKAVGPVEYAQAAPEIVAAYLTRCLFSMFAEDVNLLPKGSFLELLQTHRNEPAALQIMLRSLWADMDTGNFSIALAEKVLRFNGKLFKNSTADGYSLLLTPKQIDLLIAAAKTNWREVEPAIFGTLLERALNTKDRHMLGAHFTPRAYVERLVLPTVIEPLRAEWANAQAAALVLAHEAAELEANPPLAKGGTDAASFSRKQLKEDQEASKRHEAAVRAKWKEAHQQVKSFHHRLCTVRVLDPACGSGNFLYVTLEHLKRLEGEVAVQMADLGDTQESLTEGGETVTLQQLRGIELNERAAAVAELVLWIGYLQWHIRTHGNKGVAEPVVHDYGNIECRDAVLAWDAQEPACGASGQLLTRWDGRTFKTHPVTGALVPDETAQVAQWKYIGARQATWPEAEFIVGNPPFIGASTMRAALGDGYAEALRGVWKEVPESADFVMYWWAHAASLVACGRVQRFGLITTNSLRQTFNRRVVQAALDGESVLHVDSAGGSGAQSAGALMLSKAQKSVPGRLRPTSVKPVALDNLENQTSAAVSLVFAIPDHPWVDSANGAAVRIAMTVGARASAGSEAGHLLTVTAEQTGEHGEVAVTLAEKTGLIHADLSIGANVASAVVLRANTGVSSPGVKLHGAGFIVTFEEAAALGLGAIPGLEHVIRHYRNGRDLTDTPRGAMVIDAFGLTAEHLRSRYPAVYQWLLERVKPERNQNNRTTYRDNWWLFGEPRKELRPALLGLPRYIATVETAKHRTFQFLDASILPDNKLIAIALSDAFHLGVLSSATHGAWALAVGSWLGVGNDPVYVKSRCFETFPFPAEDTGLTPELRQKISQLTEQIDTHRKQVLGLLTSNRGATKTKLTLTALYNVMQVLRDGRALTAKEKLIHQQGLVGVLKELHDELDAAVLQAYGWAELGEPGSDELLVRLTALNARRAAEEVTGTVRWLRPGFQNAAKLLLNKELPTQVQQGLELDFVSKKALFRPILATTATAWPATLPEQVRVVAQLLASASGALTLPDIEARFNGRGAWKKGLPTLLQTLEALGRAQPVKSGTQTAWRA